MLAVVVLLLAAIATIVPQGEEAGVYVERYGVVVGRVIVALGFDRFFRSRILFGIAVLAEINLVLCTVPRMWRRARSIGSARRDTQRGFSPSRFAALFAADVIHLSLMVLLVAGIVTVAGRTREVFLLRTGEEAVFGDHRLRVVDSREIRGTSGAFENVVLDWEIDLLVATARGSSTILLRLNRPVAVEGVRYHFYHWGREAALLFRDQTGREYRMVRGEGLRTPQGASLLLAAIGEDGTATFFRLADDGSISDRFVLVPGQQLGPYAYVARGEVTITGFSATRDPGRGLVLLGLMILGVGMTLFLLRLWRQDG